MSSLCWNRKQRVSAISSERSCRTRDGMPSGPAALHLDRLSSCFLIPGSVNIMLSIPGYSGGPRSGREPLF